MVFDVNRALSASSHTQRSHLERMSELIKFKHLVARMPERVDVERVRVREFKYAHIGLAQRTEVTLVVRQ